VTQARAILWAQWRTLRNFYPRGGVAWTALIGAGWYGFWTLAALAAAKLAANPANLGMLNSVLTGGLLLVFLYWQVVPLLMAATGASLELRKLQVYPIPAGQLFSIEVMLRVTSAVEMLLIMLGLAIGLLLNPAFPKWTALAIAPYILFNLFLAVGLRDLVTRILAHKRIREVAFLLLVICAGLPQLMMVRGPVAGPERGIALRTLMRDSWGGWPWTATANLIERRSIPASLTILLAWALAAAVFGYWQFKTSLSFDADAASATGVQSLRRDGLVEKFFRFPSLLFRDPLAALIEKEIRFLVRSPRFRLVFIMGFTFGLVIWLPIMLGRSGFANSALGTNYLTVVSVYSLLLLSEVCFWNSFGFDRSAAQFYFLAPVPFSRVLIGKNLSAVFFILVEISAVTIVCACLGMPLNPVRLAEAYSVAGVLTIFLLGAGNLLSIHQARAVNPATSFRTGAAGRVQAMLIVIYPVASIPAGLAYLARWAFDSEAAFFAVLAFDAVVAVIVYRIALESAVEGAQKLKESMIAALSAGEGPIAN
jgi:ABC-2 type transport system permease protein